MEINQIKFEVYHSVLFACESLTFYPLMFILIIINLLDTQKFFLLILFSNDLLFVWKLNQFWVVQDIPYLFSNNLINVFVLIWLKNDRSWFKFSWLLFTHRLSWIDIINLCYQSLKTIYSVTWFFRPYRQNLRRS